ncbi:MAG TPA: hypothetical protein DCS93_44335 [Microscillaceae bacterium]|nr:hypothetical protein [Microscillaceae bacterium]
MKKLVKNILGKFDIGIHRISAQQAQREREQALRSHIEGQALSINDKDLINAFYADNERVKREYLTPERESFYKKIVTTVASKNIDLQDKKVLDAGCGTGHLLYFLLQEFALDKTALYGFDFSEGSVAFTQKIIEGGTFFTHDIYKPLPSEPTYDIVFCTEVLEHLLYPQQALENLLASLSPQGTCILTVPNGRIDNYNGHINFWSPESWEIFVQQVCGQNYTFETLYMDEAIKNMAIITKKS